MYAMFFFLSIYAQEILGYGALTAGLAFLPLSAGIVAGAGLAQQLIGRLGLRAVPLAGMVMSAVGMLLLAQIPVDGAYVTDLLPGLVLASVGIGLTFMPMTLLATTAVDASEAGIASGLVNTAQQVGGALGLAVLSTLAADQTTSTLDGLGHAASAADQAAALVDGFQLALLSARPDAGRRTADHRAAAPAPRPGRRPHRTRPGRRLSETNHRCAHLPQLPTRPTPY